jgi:hypothetical protein
MSPLRDKKYLAEVTGMSVDYWDDQCRAEAIPFTRFGRFIKFTDEQIEQIIAMHEVKPKNVPTRDEVARKRSTRVRGAR